MGLLDSLNKKKIQEALDATTKLAKKAGKVVDMATTAVGGAVSEQQEKIAEWNAERQETARKKKVEAENKKKREEEIASGYYMDNGQLVVSNVNGMKLWLQEIGKDTTPALLQVLQSQMQVLKYVESPSMTGMVLDNMLLCLNKALKLTSDPVQCENIRESFASMIQNYLFMNETNLRCAEKENSEETTRLLIQSGEMLSDAVSKVATTIASATPGGAASNIAKAAVMNVFEAPEAQQGYIKKVFMWLANKKILKEKQDTFYKTLEMFFETMDTHADLLGPSILTHGMLRRYRHALVDRYRQMKIQQYIDRGYKIDPKKIAQLSAGLTSAAGALVNPVKTSSGINGAMQSLGAVGGLITDFVNSSSKNGLNIEAYCDLQDALEREFDRLKAEHEQSETELQDLKARQKEVGIFNFSEKKEWQEKIDRKKAETEAVYERLQIIKTQSANMRQTFPDSFAMRSDVEAYEQNLMRIEQKFEI